MENTAISLCSAVKRRHDQRENEKYPALVIVGNKAGSLWHSKQTYELSDGLKELCVMEGAGHFDFYDNLVYIQKTIDNLAEFFEKNL